MTDLIKAMASVAAARVYPEWDRTRTQRDLIALADRNTELEQERENLLAFKDAVLADNAGPNMAEAVTDEQIEKLFRKWYRTYVCAHGMTGPGPRPAFEAGYRAALQGDK